MAVHVRMLMPNNVAFDDDVDMVVLRSVEGEMGILAGHEPCSVALSNSELRVYKDGAHTDTYAVIRGFAHVREDNVTVVSQIAEEPAKLAATLHQIEAEREENRLAEQKTDLEVHRAETALRHTLVNMDVSSYAIIKGRYEEVEETP